MIKIFMTGVILTLAAVFTLWALPHVTQWLTGLSFAGQGKRVIYGSLFLIAVLFVIYDEGVKHE